ncbi:hypothetical protein Pyn_03649 [Prunus yedoensis var. nudiflora]|uniref:Uncharacterized protein n=1 Tax=Prunus yedoensis var. nudiflora TaxID=2094558 RepID=A0A314ZMG8_PRUYE|nr:hypothetical protein Pyn_03649 [Prunus yedoensis var. nudiflora]
MVLEPTEYPLKEDSLVWLDDSEDLEMGFEKGLSGLTGRENKPAMKHSSVLKPRPTGTHRHALSQLAQKANQESQWKPLRSSISSEPW